MLIREHDSTAMNAIDMRISKTLYLLSLHHLFYTKIKPYADEYEQPHPTDSRGWSQIIVSALTGIPGLGRKKGQDLEDKSDVKAANCWDAIDKPRFNNCIKAGTQSETSDSIASLNSTPYLFFVLWDTTQFTNSKRCRIWVVNAQQDKNFHQIALEWYKRHKDGDIKSDNFQLHPPRNQDNNILRNSLGAFSYPLLFEARIDMSIKYYKPFCYNENAFNSFIEPAR